MASGKKTLSQLKEEYLIAREASIKERSIKPYQKAVVAYTKALDKADLDAEADDLRCRYLADLIARFGTGSLQAYKVWIEYIKACLTQYCTAEDLKKWVKMALTIIPQDSELYYFVFDDYIIVLRHNFEAELKGMAGERRRVAQLVYGDGSKGRIVNYMCESSTLATIDVSKGREMIALAWKEACGCEDLDSSLRSYIFLYYGASFLSEEKADELKKLCDSFTSGSDRIMASVAYYLLGQYAMDRGKDDEAEAAFTNGISLLGSKDILDHHLVLNLRLAEIYEKRGESEKVYELAAKAIRTFKGYKGHSYMQLNYHAAKAALDIGLVSESIPYILKGEDLAKELGEDTLRWDLLLADVYEALGLDDVAMSFRMVDSIFSNISENGTFDEF